MQESGVWEAPRPLVFDQRVPCFRFHVSRKKEQSPVPISEGRSSPTFSYQVVTKRRQDGSWRRCSRAGMR